jgi:hypothetical protein
MCGYVSWTEKDWGFTNMTPLPPLLVNGSWTSEVSYIFIISRNIPNKRDRSWIKFPVNHRLWKTISKIVGFDVLTATFRTLVPYSADFRTWRWRWYIPPKRRFTYGLHGVVTCWSWCLSRLDMFYRKVGSYTGLRGAIFQKRATLNKTNCNR